MLAADQEGVSPQQREHGAGELCDEVRPQTESGPELVPCGEQIAAYHLEIDHRRGHGHPGRCVFESCEHDYGDERGQRGRTDERRRPPGPAQQRHERECGRHLAGLTEDARELGDNWDVARREPEPDEPQHADEGHRVAHADQHAREHSHPHAVRQGEGELAECHDDRTQRDETTSAETVEDDTDRDLHCRIDGELKHGEGRQLTR